MKNKKKKNLNRRYIKKRFDKLKSMNSKKCGKTEIQENAYNKRKVIGTDRLQAIEQTLSKLNKTNSTEHGKQINEHFKVNHYNKIKYVRWCAVLGNTPPTI